MNANEALCAVTALASLAEADRAELARALVPRAVAPGEVIFQAGDPADGAFVLATGTCRLSLQGRAVRTYGAGSLFGEVALIDDRPRTATIVAETDSALFQLTAEAMAGLSGDLAAKVYRALGRLLTGYLRDGTTLYAQMDVLLIQDGGCAPGYNPVTASLSEHLEKSGRSVFMTREGFRSLIANRDGDYRALVHNKARFNALDHVPGVIFSPPLREARGASFRSERFPRFKEPALQRQAAEHLRARGVRVVVGIGGNGTFLGIRSLAALCEDILFFFVPVTIDSDVSGTECIGEYTGVEVGAEKVRCYLADARSHKRMYIVELMGAHGGFHALHSCLGAGAHLAVLPGHDHDLTRLVPALEAREDTVIVVAEGYREAERRTQGFSGNAAEFFRDELLAAGLNTSQKIVCEPFSRDIRGASPNNMDLMLSQRMARRVTTLLADGLGSHMPSVNAGVEGAIAFAEIRTDNSVPSALVSLANRLY